MIAFIYLLLPNSYEVHANLTNTQWHLAILACAVILAKPSQRLGWRIFDVLLVTISSLSGPFCLFLLPVIGIQWWRTKNRWTLNLLIILAVGVIVQVCALTFSDSPSNALLGATPELFFKTIGGQIFLASLIGTNGYFYVKENYGWTFFSAFLITLVGCMPLVYVLWKGKAELKLFLLFAGLITLGALLRPTITEEKPQWQEIWLPFAANRYWTIPTLAFILILIWAVSQNANKYWRAIGAIFLLILPIGIFNDWKYTPYKDLHFTEQAQKLTDAPIGSGIEIPINPDWTMKLIKK